MSVGVLNAFGDIGAVGEVGVIGVFGDADLLGAISDVSVDVGVLCACRCP